MRTLFTLIVCSNVVLVAAVLEAQQTWTPSGIWRIDVEASPGFDPAEPYLLRISTDGTELAVERSRIGSEETETSRYPLDGRPTPNVEGGHPVETTATRDETTLVITATRSLPDGRVEKTTDIYSGSRSRLAIERTVWDGEGETTSRRVFVRLPGNIPLHGGVRTHTH